VLDAVYFLVLGFSIGLWLCLSRYKVVRHSGPCWHSFGITGVFRPVHCVGDRTVFLLIVLSYLLLLWALPAFTCWLECDGLTFWQTVTFAHLSAMVAGVCVIITFTVMELTWWLLH